MSRHIRNPRRFMIRFEEYVGEPSADCFPKYKRKFTRSISETLKNGLNSIFFKAV